MDMRLYLLRVESIHLSIAIAECHGHGEKLTGSDVCNDLLFGPGFGWPTGHHDRSVSFATPSQRRRGIQWVTTFRVVQSKADIAAASMSGFIQYSESI